MMFAPEGYVNFSVMTDFLNEWAYKAYFARLLEQDGKDPKQVFSREENSQNLLMSYRLQKLRKEYPEMKYVRGDKGWDKHLEQSNEDYFGVALQFHCLLSKVLMKFDTLLASADGRIMQPDDYVFLHMDRLDWVYPSWPLRNSSELSTIFSYFDQKKFSGVSLSERYCFVDFSLGIIGFKNNSISAFEACAHFGCDTFPKRYIKSHVEPFVGWAVVWNENDLPDDYTEFFENVGFMEPSWEVSLRASSEDNKNRPTGKKGAKPTGAKDEFFRLYPAGKPENLSAEAIAAELTEAGFPISGRQIQNYAKEIKGK